MMNHAPSAAAIVVAAVSLWAALPAGAQDLATKTLHVFTGSAPNIHLGTAVGGAGDLNGDGRGDFLAGNDDRLTAVSGATGQVLYPFPAETPGDFVNAVIFPISDLDGDGRPELVVGAPRADPSGLVDAGVVLILSGATGSLIRGIPGSAAGQQFGASVALLGDENGDGSPEIVVGAPGDDPSGRVDAGGVAIVSLRDGSQLHFFRNTVAGEGLGSAVAALGDVNGDGRPDFAAGAPFADLQGQEDSGLVLVISPVDGRTIDQIVGEASFYRFGATLASNGDLDGDGAGDLLIGAPGRPAGGLAGAGTVFAWSLLGRRVLYRVEGRAAQDGFGAVLAGGGDFDGDGRLDFVVGAPLADADGSVDAGRAQVHSGVDGRLLATFTGNPGEQMGAAVALMPDASGDGRAEVIVGAPLHDEGGMVDAGIVGVVGLGDL